MTYEEYKKKIQKNSNASLFKRDSYSQSFISNEKLASIGEDSPYRSAYAFNPDLDTSEGLYNLSVQAGLKDKADRAVTAAGGESNKFFSGGIIMDAMDILNASSYGVVGLLKGKTLAEGVRDRESFSDEDSLGKYGWVGKIAGLVADIVVDPVTYVSPWKQIARIPGVAKTVTSATEKAFGELRTIKIAGQEAQWRSGGWKPLNFLADHLVYGHAVSKDFRDSFEKEIASKTNAMMQADEIMAPFAAIDPRIAKETLGFADDGSMVSRPMDEVLKSPGMAGKETDVTRMYEMRDNLMQQLVDEGIISEAAKDKHWGSYLMQSYDEYMLGKVKNFKKKGTSIDNRSRIATKETRGKLTHVEDAAAVWAGTFKKQIENLHNARINKMAAQHFALDDAGFELLKKEGGDVTQYVKVPDSPNYKIAGETIDLKIAYKSTTKTLKSILKERGRVLKDERSIQNELANIKRLADNAEQVSSKEWNKAINGLKTTLKEEGLYTGPTKKVPTSQGQRALAEVIGKWLKRGTKSERLARETMSTKDLADEMFETVDGVLYAKTKEGLALQKAFDDPATMYQWQSPVEFIDAIRYPDKTVGFSEGGSVTSKLSDAEQELALKKSERAARKMGRLAVKKEGNEVALDLVQKRVDDLEQQYADTLFKRKNILDSLNENSRGQLAGKWMHKDTWAMLKESTDPAREFGEPVVMYFKHAKVIWNISAYPRNAMSAMVQNWWRLGLGPWNVKAYINALHELRNNGPLLKEMKETGFSMRSGALDEIRANYITESTVGKSIGGPAAKVKEKVKHIDRMFANVYGHIDNVAKIAAYKYGRDVKGWAPEKALKAAYEATYNYSQVTPFVHRMRRAIWGVPFITFNLKSIELVASTLKYAPERISVFGKAKNALFQSAGIEAEQEGEVMPGWMRDSFVMRLPWKDGEGRSMYFDMSYILPVGAILNGEYLKNPAGQNPVLNTFKELSQNKTFSGYRIFNEYDDLEQVAVDVWLHSMKLAVPPTVAEQFSKGYDSNGNRVFSNTSVFRDRNTQDRGAGERSFYQEMFRLAGMNVTPFDMESKERTFDFTRKKNLQKMLSDEGILKEFIRPYIPEDSTAVKDNLYDPKSTQGSPTTSF